VEYYVFMYVSGIMRPVELFQEWGEEEVKENDGGGEFNYNVL
jgi:hypothetical protein